MQYSGADWDELLKRGMLWAYGNGYLERKWAGQAGYGKEEVNARKQERAARDESYIEEKMKGRNRWQRRRGGRKAQAEQRGQEHAVLSRLSIEAAVPGARLW